MTTRAVTGHSIPGAHALDLVELAERFGVSADSLLAETSLAESGLTVASLSLPDARIALGDVERIVTRAIALTRQPALGILLGLRMRVPAHGYLGFAAMTAPSVRHALELAVRYAPTRTSALSLRLEEHADSAVLFIDEHADFGAARATVLLALSVGLWRIAETLTGQKFVGTGEFAFSSPDFTLPLEGTSFAVHFGMPHNALRFQRAYLSLPLNMSEPSASLLAQEQLERALEALDRSGLVTQVRKHVARAGGGVNTVDDVAAALGISTRTLHRKLRAEGVVFSELVDAVQEELSSTLLADPALSVEAVAERVGYSDVSNFTRAFKRWTGSTPAAFRRAKASAR